VNVSDITPTIYELLGVTPPETYQGIEQIPVTGHSFQAALGDAEAPSTNKLQYFENSGSRALIAEYEDVWWKAVTKHNQGDDFDSEPWELYDLTSDPSECTDLAVAEPQRLAQLVDLWWQEAERHGVLPLDDRTLELFAANPSDHSPHRLNRRYLYRPPMSPIPAGASAGLGGRAVDLTARVTSAVGDEGVLWATGTENSGFSVFVQNGRLVVDYNSFDNHTIVESTIEVPPGDSSLGVHLERDSRTSGWVEVSIDGKACGRAPIPSYMRIISSVGASVGEDYGSGVSNRYSAPFAFTGTLHEVVIQRLQRDSGREGSGSAASETTATARAEMSRQ
jgi:arylsulfatase